ncbi:MAG: hypothetical protein ACK5D5_10395 [Bacteroidota bacterium]|jgi:hypothetical protein
MNTGIQIKTGFFPLAWFLYFVDPIIEINGVKNKASWGTKFFQLAPGDYSIKIYFSYFGNPQCGSNEVKVSVAEGIIKRINYEMPPWMFAKGSISVE